MRCESTRIFAFGRRSRHPISTIYRTSPLKSANLLAKRGRIVDREKLGHGFLPGSSSTIDHRFQGYDRWQVTANQIGSQADLSLESAVVLRPIRFSWETAHIPGMTRCQGPGGTMMLGMPAASGCGDELDGVADGWPGTLITESKGSHGIAKADVATFEAKTFDFYTGNLERAATDRWWRILVSSNAPRRAAAHVLLRRHRPDRSKSASAAGSRVERQEMQRVQIPALTARATLPSV